jgi:tRNA modification GTPase
VAIDFTGYPLVFSDTAGLRETADVVEAEGVRRAVQRISSSDLGILVLDAAWLQSQAREAIAAHLREMVPQALRQGGSPIVLLVNKVDLLDGMSEERIADYVAELSNPVGGLLSKVDTTFLGVWAASCQSGQGMTGFQSMLATILQERFEKVLASPHATKERHRTHLMVCADHLRRFDGMFSCCYLA